MTREIALFTKMRSVCINDRMGNYWLVKNMRDDLSEAYIDFVTFDAFAHKDVDHVMIMFSVNEELENINPNTYQQLWHSLLQENTSMIVNCHIRFFMMERLTGF